MATRASVGVPDEGAAAGQAHLAPIDPVDLLFELVPREQRLLAGVVLQHVEVLGMVVLEEGLRGTEGVLVVDLELPRRP
jgi:hypothetical protein